MGRDAAVTRSGVGKVAWPGVWLAVVLGCAPRQVGRATGESCGEEAVLACHGQTPRICRGGEWLEQDACPAEQVCADRLGCAACNPAAGTACVGNAVHSCRGDGTVGPRMQECGAAGCSAGQCGGHACAAGAEDIYVIDDRSRLLRFTPAGERHTFTELGALDCPAGPAWPSWAGGAHPFSMSVDRQGNAWVLYSSGELFRVPVADPARCTLTSFAPGRAGFEIFGMGFAATGRDGPERLYVAGGRAAASSGAAGARLGVLEAQTGELRPIGDLSPGEHWPELSGTGAGELYAYYPGVQGENLVLLDRDSGRSARRWNLAGLQGQATAWAFAHWGGRFYLFTSVSRAGGGDQTEVRRFDPMTGDGRVVARDVPYRIVGAGVSTCAPVQVE
jgi:hypothetical protein